jgi:hypothetical protein
MRSSNGAAVFFLSTFALLNHAAEIGYVSNIIVNQELYSGNRSIY